MNKTKIDWCDSTWNPVTGCLHGCEYCYARRIAKRFGGASETHCNETVGTECQWETSAEGKIHVLGEPIYDYDYGRNAPYPYEFDPTFHKYRLNEYQNKKGRNIFVCSMADLFGEWVPDEWIEEVIKGCNADRHLCQTCRYRGASGLNGCDYILFEGHSRGCKVEECIRYERGARKRVEKVKGVFPRK